MSKTCGLRCRFCSPISGSRDGHCCDPDVARAIGFPGATVRVELGKVCLRVSCGEQLSLFVLPATL